MNPSTPSNSQSTGGVLDYAPASKRGGARLLRPFVRVGTLLLCLGLLFSSLMAGARLSEIGSPLPRFALVMLAGITQRTALDTLLEKLSTSAHYLTIEQRDIVEALLRQCGVTALATAGEESAGSGNELAGAFVVSTHGWDRQKHIWWCRLPNGWLEVGEHSALYWPDSKRWYYEYRSQLDATAVEGSRVLCLDPVVCRFVRNSCVSNGAEFRDFLLS